MPAKDPGYRGSALLSSVTGQFFMGFGNWLLYFDNMASNSACSWAWTCAQLTTCCRSLLTGTATRKVQAIFFLPATASLQSRVTSNLPSALAGHSFELPG